MPSAGQWIDVLKGPVVNPANGHIYYLLSPANWPAAEAFAQDFGGHLATVRNQAEHDWLWSVFSAYEGNTRSFWIGLNDPDPYVTSPDLQQRKLEFSWSSGEPVTYSNWDTFQPDFGGTVPTQSGVTFWDQPGGKWDNDFTNVAHRAVAELVPPDEPLILDALRDTGATFGSLTRLIVTATGARPLFYQWQFNGSDVPQATNATLTLNPLRVSHDGKYSVRVWNAFGETRGGPFALHVGTLLNLISFGATWSFWDRGAAPPAEWRTVDFDDTQWGSGRAQLGYGEGDEVTPVGYGPSIENKYITTWFRSRFFVLNPSMLSGLTVRLLRDDGAVGYLNGQEIFRANMTSGPIGPGTFALDQTTGSAETVLSTYTVDSTLLVPGTNVLAVEVHQSDRASSDLSFDLQLRALESLPPLRIHALTADELQLSWSSTQLPAVLEQAGALEPSSWEAVAAEISEVDGIRQTIVTRQSTGAFYRLRRP